MSSGGAIPLFVDDSYDEQLALLDRIEASGLTLEDGLAAHGLGYDDLHYETSGVLHWRGRRALTLNDVRRETVGPDYVSFFTGCGGVDLGFEAVGLRHQAAFEINPLFCHTLRQNRPDWHVYGPPDHSGDVSKHDEIINALSQRIRSSFDGVFVGGPPCQPFSIAANQRFSRAGENFKRTGFRHQTNGNLLFDYARLVIEFRPRAFLIENVPGLRDIDGGEQLQEAIALLEKAGYSVERPRVLDASNYGIAQFRQRLFVVGSLTRRPFRWPKAQPDTVGCGAVLKDVPTDKPNHETRAHRLESIRRYMVLDYGARDALGRVDRLNPAIPSKTVIAGGTGGGGRSHLHPEIPRTLSVRECARLQTFPDDYVFYGPTARQFTQVGNAVPPVLAAHMGIALMESFY